MEFIQRNLDALGATWNIHGIASKTNLTQGDNRPLMMYTLPELYNVDDRLCPVDKEEIEVCSEETLPKVGLPCDDMVKPLCKIIMEESRLQTQILFKKQDNFAAVIIECQQFVPLRVE